METLGSGALLMSTSRTVHNTSCPTMRHVQNGRAIDHRIGFEGQPVSRALDVSDGNAYHLCFTCAPNFPPYRARRRYSAKAASRLSGEDIGRETDYGRIVRIEHFESSVAVDTEDGFSLTYVRGEQVAFVIASGRTEAKR